MTRRRLRAEREPDAQFLPAACDDEGHHAIEADGRQQRGHAAKTGGEHGDEAVREQRLVELPLDRFHLVHGNTGVELTNLVANLGEDVSRRGLRAQIEDRAVLAPVGNEHLPVHAFARAFVQGVGHDADDLGVELAARAAAESEPPADGVLPREVMVGELPVYDRDVVRVRRPIHIPRILARKSRPLCRGIFIVSK